MSSSRRTAILTTTGVAVIMLVIGVAIGSLVSPITRTQTTRQFTTLTASQTLVSMLVQTVTKDVTVTETLGTIPCSSVYPDGLGAPDAGIQRQPAIVARQNSTALVCVRYYYYDSYPRFTGLSDFPTAGELSISYLNPYESIPKVNFTINAYPPEISLSGPSNLNEGAFVLYTINTGDTSNGTYRVNLFATLYPSQENCGGFTRFIVSNPNPNYAFFDKCSQVVTSQYPLNSYGFVGGDLYAEVVGISNST